MVKLLTNGQGWNDLQIKELLTNMSWKKYLVLNT